VHLPIKEEVDLTNPINSIQKQKIWGNMEEMEKQMRMDSINVFRAFHSRPN
jgi:hypothetical protein